MSQNVKINKTIEKHTVRQRRSKDETNTTTTTAESHTWKLVDYTIVTTVSVLLVLLILYAVKRISKLFKGSDKDE